MKSWRPLRNDEYPPPGPTRTVALCICGDTKSAHGNPAHGCDAGGFKPSGFNRILVLAEPYPRAASEGATDGT